jgi:hypothetical protein
MAEKITRDTVESYLNCKHKAHLKLAGQQGSKSGVFLIIAFLRG